MRCELGWDNALYSAKPANHPESGIGQRDSPQRCVLAGRRLDREFLKHFGSSDTSKRKG